MSARYIALIHHPIRSREGEEMTTAVTNLDVHDLARLGRTFDAAAYFIVTPIELQRRLVQEIVDHWREGGPGAKRIPQRSEALRRVEAVTCLEEAVRRITSREGRRPRVLGTAARPLDRPVVSFAEERQRLGVTQEPILVLFGTGHGLTDALLANVDDVLAPIRPGADFNHLSVRTAAAIVLDRLFAADRPD